MPIVLIGMHVFEVPDIHRIAHRDQLNQRSDVGCVAIMTGAQAPPRDGQVRRLIYQMSGDR